MPPDTPDFAVRSAQREILDEPCEREVLRAYLRDIARTNRWTLGYRPTLHWLESTKPALASLGRPLRILDVGCGYGDGLRRIEQWARSRSGAVQLTGIDINADTIAIAAESSPGASRIRWICADVFAYEPPEPIDLIVSALFTHHLDDDEILRFLAWTERHAQFGWFINDLSRAAVPYHVFRAFSRLIGLHPFVQKDGPVSITRAFVPEDWRRMCATAGLDSSAFRIQSFKPARLCVARSKQR